MGEQTCVRILGGDRNICNVLGSDLEELGFNPSQGRYSDIYTDDITQIPPSIMILELTVLDHDALSICELLSHDGNLQPETALVALVSEKTMGQVPLVDRFADFIKFPYEVAELGFRLQRVTHLLHQGSYRNIISIGSLSLSPSECEVKIDRKTIALTYKEYELLKYLIIHNDQVFTREELLTSIWGDNVTNGSRTVDVHISRVRAKIGDITGAYIKTVRGKGYIFNSEGNNI